MVPLRRLGQDLQAAIYLKVESTQPRRQRQGPRRPGDDRRGRAPRLAAARRHHHRGHRRQHRRRPGHGRRRQGLPLHLRPARQDERREDPPAQGLRRRGRHHAHQRRPRFARELQRRRRPPGPRDPRRLAAQPVHQPGQPRDPLPHHRPGNLGADRGPDHRLRRRRRHRRHHLRRRPLPQGAEPRRSRSSAPIPEGSVLSGGSPRPWKVEGIGEDFVPKTFNSQLVDEWIRVGDAESFHTARALARREGMLVGGSSGTAVAAAAPLRPPPRTATTWSSRSAPTPAATT